MSRRPRVCFVIQRYGDEVTGGAEALCRDVARRLADDYRITVLTTCALDYLTWKDHYPAGPSHDAGVELIRFPVVRPRRLRSFGRFSRRIFTHAHLLSEEMEWMERQGPDVPSLTDYVAAHRDRYDLWVFFTYLYATTFLPLPHVAHRAVLVPMAHDEEPLRLGIFQYLFHLPRGLVFNTPEERDFVQRTFNCGHIPHTVTGGTGIDLPPEAPPRSADGQPYLLYAGRIDSEKGMAELFTFFHRFSQAHGKPGLRLRLCGTLAMELPRHAEIEYLGYLSEEEKAAAFDGCLALVAPSPYESLSITSLEAWAHGKPVLANGRSEVLAGQVKRSGGGLTYRSPEEFEKTLRRLAEQPALRAELGAAGREFVRLNYSWDVIRGNYREFFDCLLAQVAVPG